MQGAPLEVRRHLDLIRVLDQRWFHKMGQLQRAQDNYLRRVREEKRKLGDDPKVDIFAATEDRPALDRIRTLRAEALQLATEKVLVAEQAYVTMRMRLERVARDYTTYRDAVRKENNNVPPELAGDPLLMYQHSSPPHGVPQELTAAFDRRGRGGYDDGAGGGGGYERGGSGAGAGGGGSSEFVTGEEMDQAVAAAGAEGDDRDDDRGGRGGGRGGWGDGEGAGAATSFVGSRGPGQGITLPPDVVSSLRAASSTGGGGGGRGGGGGGGGAGRGRGAAAEREREESAPGSEAEDGDAGGGADVKYCLCKRPAYGEMVGCDNDQCTVGNSWFHLSCVGLSAAPEGKWYCPDCTKKMELQAAARGRKGPPARPAGGAAGPAGAGARR